MPLGAETSRAERLIVFFSTGAYLGLSPWAPGTFGTLAGIPPYLVLAMLPSWGYLLGLAGLAAASIYLSGRADKIFGSHDNRRIVIDEVVGYTVTMAGVAPSVSAVILGFCLFRVFDIIKPWPCSAIDRKIGGGLGVTLDDVAAGIYAAIVMQIMIRIWPFFGHPGW